MTSSEFNAARAYLEQTDDELAADLLVTPAIIRAWSAGSAQIPARYARQITWLSEGARRTVALASAGLPDCEWIARESEKEIPGDPKEALKHFRALEQHASSCEVCAARERFIAEHFGPMPRLQQPGWMRAFTWAERLPARARPAAFGAFLLGGIVAFRMLFVLPSIISSPRRIGQAVVTLLAAAAAGASGGLAYAITRPAFKRLGRLGDYLTGITCVLSYLTALALLAPVAFGENLVSDRVGVFSFAVVGIFFGLLVGHSWFRDE